MDRKDRDKDIKARGIAYQQGLVRILRAIEEFRELTGVDLQPDIDVSGRHMGEKPYLKITAERLAEVTAQIEGDIWRTASPELTELGLAEAAAEAKVFEFSAYRTGAKP